MSALLVVQAIFSEAIVERLGWVLVHSLWQFALVGLFAAIVLRAMRRSSAEARSGVLIGLLTFLMACPIVTWMVQTSASRSQIAPEGPAVRHDSPSVDARPIVSQPAGASNLHDTQVMAETGNPAGAPTLVASASIDAAPQLTWMERAKTILQPWLAWAVGFWGLGVALCSLRPLVGWLTLRQLKRVGVSPASKEALASLARVSQRMGLSRSVRVLQSSLAQVPLVVGYLQPVILLPVSLLTSIPAAQLEAILAHELAHIRRHDFVVNLLQILAETVFFYHPAVWWLSHRIRVEREHACDDLVVRVLDNRREYGRALIAVEELRGRSPVFALGAADGSLLERVRRIAMRPNQRTGLSTATGFCLLISLAGMVVLVSLLGNRSIAAMDQNKDEPPSVSPAEDAANSNLTNDNASLAEIVRNFNAKNRELGRGFDQPPLTEDEVIASIKRSDWKHDVSEVSEREFASFKAVAESRRLPKECYFDVYTSEEPLPLTVIHKWEVRLFMPAQDSDGFVGFPIRNTRLGEEQIEPKSVAWGKPDPDGLSLGLYLQPHKREYRVGERVRLRLFVRNDGKQAVENMTFYNITWPTPADFTVTDEAGAKVAVRNVHDEWSGPMWIAGAMLGGLEPDAVHAFRVPFELAIGGDGASKLVGRVIEARPGQTLHMRVRAHNGSDRKRAADEPAPETGILTVAVATEKPSEPASAGGDEPQSAVPAETPITAPIRIPQEVKATAGPPTFTLPDHRSVATLGFSPDGKSLVSITWEKAPDSDGTRFMIRTWNVAEKTLAREVELQWQQEWNRGAGSMVLSKDRTKVVSILENEVGIWDVVTGKLVGRLKPPEKLKEDYLHGLDCTPDASLVACGSESKYVASATISDSHVIVWDARVERVTKVIKQKNVSNVPCLSLSTDGKRLATIAMVWDVASGKQLLDFRNANPGLKHPDLELQPRVSEMISSVSLSPDGKLLAVSDMIGVKLVEVDSGKIVQRMEGPYRYYSGGRELVFSANGELLARIGTCTKLGQKPTERVTPIWSTKTGKLVTALPIEANDASISDDGQWVAVGFSDLKGAGQMWRITPPKTRP